MLPCYRRCIAYVLAKKEIGTRIFPTEVAGGPTSIFDHFKIAPNKGRAKFGAHHPFTELASIRRDDYVISRRHIVSREHVSAASAPLRDFRGTGLVDASEI